MTLTEKIDAQRKGMSASVDDKRPAKLILEDGRTFEGTAFGANSSVAGEVVFNTGMVGYPESLTDPSYKGQILTLTYPLIGNYGVPDYQNDMYGLPIGLESDRVQVAGLVVAEHSTHYSHRSGRRTLERWLKDENILGICGVDTRALTRHLRDRGSMLGKIELSNETIQFWDPNSVDLASEVSTSEVIHYKANNNGTGSPTVVVIDCGCKANIIRSLLLRGMNVTRIPHDYYFLNLDFDGLVISNGPGDPRMYETTVKNVMRVLALGRPLLGICLGHQLLALAVGGDTYKLRYGHRSHNQPCVEMSSDSSRRLVPSGRCVITSQNHGFAVREKGLPDDWRVWFTNANDGTVEGIRHISKPFAAVQFHPEASPGPIDTAWIFDEFVASIRR